MAFASFVGLLAPGPALASPNVISDALTNYVLRANPSLPGKPSIINKSLCHKPGKDIRDLKPFGASVIDITGHYDKEKNPISREEFERAYETLDDARIDVDCDGYPDFDEIVAGFSPNEADNHPSGEPSLVPCSKPLARGAAGGGGDEGGEVGDEGGGDPEVTPSPGAEPASSSCAFSPSQRPLDRGALFATLGVMLPLLRRVLRPRRR